jgi:hypothetical protein
MSPFSCTLCGGTDWPNTWTSCPLCYGEPRPDPDDLPDEPEPEDEL